MNRILSLIRVDLNTTFGISSLKYKLKDKNERWTYIILFIALLSLLPTYYMIVSQLFGLYNAYLNMGQKSMFLLNGILIAQLAVFFFGIIYVLSKYYFSNDLNVLVPLPLRPREIIGAKFIILMINEYLTSLPIILPFIIIYGIRENGSILYWIYSIVIILFAPVIPLTLSSIIVMFFMKYTNIKGKKDLLRIVGYFLLIFIFIAVQMKIQYEVQKSLLSEEDFFIKVITDSSLFVKRLGIIFPPSMWATLSIYNSLNITGLLYLILFTAVSIAIFLIMLFLSERVFFAGLIGNLEVSTSRGRGKVSTKDFGKRNPVYLSIGLKEIKMLLRTPVYLINSVGGVVIVPVILVMSIFMSGEEALDVMKMFIADNTELIYLLGAGLIVLLGIMNCVGCTTFSREGKNLWIQRTLPIEAKDQIFGRVLASLFVQMIGILALFCGMAYLRILNLKGAFWIVLLGILGSIPLTQMGMIVDIFKPMLVWDDPQKPMKQNLNVLISLGIGTLYLLAIGLLVYVLLDKIDMLFIYLILGAIFIITSYLLYIPLKKLIEGQFKVLE